VKGARELMSAAVSTSVFCVTHRAIARRAQSTSPPEVDAAALTTAALENLPFSQKALALKAHDVLAQRRIVRSPGLTTASRDVG
jgi:hypothetical protein